ncbi:MAG: hypothetical protein QXX18_07195 [Candidatus Jordarchaeales archaeon]
MLDEKRGSIVLPPGVARYYMLTFISFLERGKIESTAVYGDRLEIRTTAGSVAELLAGGISQATLTLKRYHERWKGVEIPASGNDKKIFASLMKRLSLPEGSSFLDALTAYSNELRSYKPQDTAAAFSRFGKGEFSLPSIFKPEQYALSRAPFMKGKEKYDAKVNLDYFMILLAGYVLSRCGRVKYEAGGGQQAWHTLHVFPYDIGANPLVFRRLVECLSQEEGWGLPPGLRPEEAVILWLAMLVPDDAPDIILVSMKDPGGQKAAEIGVSYYLPLGSFIARSGRALRKIREDENASKFLRWLLQGALTPAVGDRVHDRAVELVKLLFIALQGGELQRAELLLRASRVEASKIRQGERDEEYWVAYRGRVLAEKIASS